LPKGRRRKELGRGDEYLGERKKKRDRRNKEVLNELRSVQET